MEKEIWLNTKNPYWWLLGIGFTVVFSLILLAEPIVELIKSNLEIARVIWFGMGLLGLYIFNKTRAGFFEKQGFFAKIYIFFFYMGIGPLILALSLITLFNINIKIQK